MKLIFGLLLILITERVTAFDSSDVLLIDKYGIINTNKKRSDDWKIETEGFDQKQTRFLNQTRDITPWRELDPYEWLDFKKWQTQRKIKDENPEWRRLFREALNKELVGRVLKCVGVCHNYRGERKHDVEYLSQIKEGDEIVTQVGSAMWIVLLDGTLVRMASETSISFNEINLSMKKIQYMMRLNYGYSNIVNRWHGTYEDINRAESDMAFHPLKVLKANREYYMLQEYRSFSPQERLQYAVVPNPGYVSQFVALNKIMIENSKQLFKRDTEILLYTPTITLDLKNISTDIFYGIKNSTVFRLKNGMKNFTSKDPRTSAGLANLRGYKNDQEESLEVNKWYSTDAKGKSLNSFAGDGGKYEAIASFSERIPSISMARELWLKEFSLPILSAGKDYRMFANKLGYRLWNNVDEEELLKRKQFAKEYIRRTETTILKNMDYVFRSYPATELSLKHYERSLKLHYRKIKGRFERQRIMVREMNDTQYYLWTIRYGQEFLQSRTR